VTAVVDARATGSIASGKVDTAGSTTPRLVLLGGFEATVAGSPVRVSDSAARLVAFAALHDGPLSRSYVAGSLWPETTDARAAANLRSALWRLRQNAPSIVDAHGVPLRLGGSVRVDVVEARRSMWSILDHNEEPRTSTLQSILAWGDLLPGWYDDWVILERDRFHELRLRTLQTLSERFTAVGRFGPAIDAGSAATREEPLRESAHRALIRAHLAEGNVGEALRHYRRYERILDEELGLAPSPEMRDLIEVLTVL
jgi:DNA-binding SARP family transcriptional activator